MQKDPEKLWQSRIRLDKRLGDEAGGSEMAKATGLRVMYWPNEPAHLYPDFLQAGGRAAFAAMQDEKFIDALSIYSQRVERAKFPSSATFEEAARREIVEFAPDILFVQHLFGTDMTEAFWQRLRQDLPQVTLVYHEGDAFDRWVKRLDRPTISILRHADLVLACGLGSLADILNEHARCRIGFMPHCFVKSRFATRDPTRAEKRDLVTMIGTRGNRRRIRFLYCPGGRNRAKLATRLSQSFGTGLALYGSGWSKIVGSRGFLPFFQQEEAIQAARITANWDHYDHLDFYYSDRLPISLAAGVPHVTSYHAGYDHLFEGVPGLYACKSIPEAVDTCRWLLSRSDADLLEEGLAAKEWAFANTEANIVFRRGMDQAVEVHQERMRG